MTGAEGSPELLVIISVIGPLLLARLGFHPRAGIPGLANLAVAEYVLMNARVGRKDEIDRIYSRIEGRDEACALEQVQRQVPTLPKQGSHSTWDEEQEDADLDMLLKIADQIETSSGLPRSFGELRHRLAETFTQLPEEDTFWAWLRDFQRRSPKS